LSLTPSRPSYASYSLKIVFQQLEEAKEAEIEEAFRMDYRVGQRLLTSPAASKAGLAGLQGVSVDQVSSFFQPFAPGEEELDLPEREQVSEEQPERRYIDRELQRRFGKTTTTRGSI
jgi:hypothetical protein